MAKINVLPKSISELIAAGEVCERPSSVVKELVENSIDAGADKISVEIRAGGNKYIRITDNGCGIERGDVATAFLSHATSKIASSGDLEAIYTLGFRGEALASVCAVSKTEMLTRTTASEFGTRYVIEGGAEILLDDAGCPQGTTIVVRDLFFNTPARMKFLKKDVTEGNYVSDVVTKAALSHPEISFRLIKDDKEVLFTPGSGVLTDAVAAVFGKEFASGLVPCDYELNGVSVKGLVSKPLYGRPNRNMQHFFVNLRYVKIPFAASALDQAYKNSIMTGKFPSAVLFIGVLANTVDVNVHPAKTEVRFSDEKRVFEAVYYAVKNALNAGDTRPQMKLPPQKEIKDYQKFLQAQAEQPQAVQQKLNLEAENNNAAQAANAEEKKHSIAFKRLNINFDEAPAPREKTVTPSFVSDGSFTYSPDNNENISVLINNTVAQNDDISKTPPALEDEKIRADSDKKTIAETAEEAPLKIIGEAFKTYIIAEYGKKLLIIDKHAAHERLIFNKLKSEGQSPHSQILLSPLNVTLSKKEYAAVIENLELLEQAGFAVSDFGEGNVLVRECPQGVPYGELEDLLCELADYLCSHVKELMSEKLDWIYHSAACRAAVKAGDSASNAELLALAKEIVENGDVMYCPHGRPVLVEMTKQGLEKQFGRLQ